jgi:hypothetical protein
MQYFLIAFFDYFLCINEEKKNDKKQKKTKETERDFCTILGKDSSASQPKKRKNLTIL